MQTPPLCGRGYLFDSLQGPLHVPQDQADFLFFLSSSTSVNSASTTLSFLGSPPGPSDGCSAVCLYIASPSFIAACCSVPVLAVIAAASSPFKASLRSAIAFSIARRSP